MQVIDDRTKEQKNTHTCLIVGTDDLMRKWILKGNGVYYVAWACVPKDSTDCFIWVERRGDMLRVREVFDSPSYRYRPTLKGHLHIYVWER